MKKVITYGTYDLFHHGHLSLLKRAKELGDYLIVGITTENFDKSRGKLNVHDNLMDRITNVMNTGLVDKIIIEEYEGQKIEDIQKYNVDIFTVGSDWVGKFDYLDEYCKVIYLERTRGISSTQLRNENTKIIKIGIVGSDIVAKHFISETKFVSGAHIESIFNPDINLAKQFADEEELNSYTDNLEELCSNVDAIYVASLQLVSKENLRYFIDKSKHVLCEIPLVLNAEEALKLYNLAEEKNLVFLEDIKTAFYPAFLHLVTIVKSGVIGKIKDIDVSLSKMHSICTSEIESSEVNILSLLSYALLPIVKFLGIDYTNIKFYSVFENDSNIFTRGIVEYESSVSSFRIGLGAKTENTLIISGTKGYVYVPAPWWKTDYFEFRFDDLSNTKKYFYKYDGFGFRYEINEFISNINDRKIVSHRISPKDSIVITKLVEQYRKNINQIKSLSEV